MGEYRPSGNAKAFCIMILAVVFAIVVSLGTVIAIVSRTLPLFILLGVFSVFLLAVGGLLPRVFRNNKVVISEDDITAIKGIINSRTSYMLIDSVKSVTVVVTPFGDRTGINFIILNAMGARLVLSFLTKTDCLKIAAHIDRKIKARR